MSTHTPLPDWKMEILETYGPLLTNTGGNDPRELLEDLQPYEDGRPNRLMSTNVVRFVLAIGIEAQVSLIKVLQEEGMLLTNYYKKR